MRRAGLWGNSRCPRCCLVGAWPFPSSFLVGRRIGLGGEGSVRQCLAYQGPRAHPWLERYIYCGSRKQAKVLWWQVWYGFNVGCGGQCCPAKTVAGATGAASIMASPQLLTQEGWKQRHLCCRCCSWKVLPLPGLLVVRKALNFFFYDRSL